MSFDNGILNLANWAGNVIMPTLAALFIALAILEFSKGRDHTHSVYGALACLLVSGLARAFETFAAQKNWDDPDRYWVSLLTMVDWVCNVLLPVYAGVQVVASVFSLASDHHFTPTSKWMKQLISAGLCLMVSGLLRLAEFFIARGTAGIT